MALQTSGAISLNQIHVEAGGTSGTSVTINDSDIRGLSAASGYTIPTSSGSTIDFGDFYGASGWSHVVTEGNYNNTYYGYFSNVGSISPTSYSGKTIYAGPYKQSTALWFWLTDASTANFFTTFTFEASDGTVISVDSADATSAISSGHRFWVWGSSDFDTGHHAKFLTTFDGSGTTNFTVS